MDALFDRDRARQEVKTLTAAIERYADTLILDQPLDETSPLHRAVVAYDLRSFLNFAANGGLLAVGESRLAERSYTKHDAEWLEFDDDVRPAPFKCADCGGMVPGSHVVDSPCPYCGSKRIVEKGEDEE